MPPGGDSTSSMRFQAAMHQIGDLQTQIQELQQKNKVLTQHNQELQEKLQLCSHQVRSYEQSLPSHFQQDQHEDTAPVDERDKLSKQEMRYRIIYLKKQLDHAEKEHSMQMKEQENKYDRLKEKASFYENALGRVRKNGFAFLLNQLEYVKQIEFLFPEREQHGMGGMFKLIKSMKDQLKQYHKNMKEQSVLSTADTKTKKTRLSEESDETGFFIGNQYFKVDDSTISKSLVADLSRTLKSMDRENAELNERIKFLEGELQANNKVSAKVQKAFSLVRQYQEAVKKLHHQLRRTRDQLDSKEHDYLEIKAQFQELQHTASSKFENDERQHSFSSPSSPKRQQVQSRTPLAHSSYRNLVSVLPSLQPTLSPQEHLTKFPDNAEYGIDNNNWEHNEYFIGATSEQTHSESGSRESTNMEDRESTMSSKQPGYSSDASAENRLNYSRLVATGGREADSNGSTGRSPSTIESSKSAEEDTQALIDDIQTLLDYFDNGREANVADSEEEV